MFRNFRIMVLLYVLLFVAVAVWLSKARSTDWDQPPNVVLYFINGDGSQTSAEYIDELSGPVFNAIEDYFQDQAGRY